jgi:tetratricopeptide (TPR) repeat protein
MAKLVRFFVVALSALLCSVAASGQLTSFGFTAGTGEDQMSTEIAKEGDAQKKIAMLSDFVQKFAGNPLAVAYGNWQLALLYQSAGDLKQAMAAGDKALAAAPNAMEIALTMIQIAKQAKDNVKIVEYAVAGAKAFHSIASQPKGELKDQDYADKIKQEEAAARPNYQFLEAEAYNAIVATDDPRARFKMVEQFTPAFPDSPYGDAVAQYALYSLQQLNDFAGLEAYGAKAIAANPKSPAILVAMARAFAEDSKAPKLDKAQEYAKRAITLANEDKDLSPDKRNLYLGLAHYASGYAMLRQEKTLPGIAELKEAVPLLKSDPSQQAPALYWLGWAYAKLNRLGEAKTELAAAAVIEGPYQSLSRDLLAKVNNAKPLVRRTK